MSNLAITSQNASPFNTIRHVDESGIEFWFARELMPLLGYKKWERFEDAISRAIAACQNAGNKASEHLFPEPGRVGISGKDYRLSRYGAYMVAMNGDPRKPEVAAAQSYFAVKTREAELRQTQQPQLTQMEMVAIAAQKLVELERWQKEQERKQLEQERRQQVIESDVAEMKQVREQAKEELLALPPSSEVPPESLDMKVRRVVNNYCSATGISHPEAWKNLYQQFYYRYHRNVKPLEKESKIQAFIRLGLIESLYELAVELFAPVHSG